MRWLRAVYRAVALCLASAFWYLLWVPGKLLLAPRPAARLRWRQFILRHWARALARSFGMRLTVRGTPPPPPFFLVANHLSYLDIVAFSSCLNCVFVSRHDLAHWPGIGLLARSVGTIFLDRRRLQDIPRVIGLINQTLDEGSGIVLFPEGTSTKGDKVLPFSAALLEPAAQANYPVSYAAVTYRTPVGETPAHDAVCWWGDMDFVPHVWGLLQVKSFEGEITFGDHTIQASNRRTLAKALWEAVNREFHPVVLPEAEPPAQLKQ